MQINDVKSCAFDYWYDLFKDVTEERYAYFVRNTLLPFSVILPLPKDVVKSLLEDRIILPKSARLHEPQSEDSDDDCEVWTDESEAPERPEFPEFEAKVSDAIAQLGGCVFPKLNWSAPKVSSRYTVYRFLSQDAYWLLGDNSLRCRSFTDVYLVLKASDFIAHDLTAPLLHLEKKDASNSFALCTDFPVENLHDPVEDYQPQLVVRRWKDCRPDSEFRCFQYLSAIMTPTSSRQFIIRNQSRRSYVLSFRSTFAIIFRFPTSSRSRVDLIDFNVFGQPTDSLLFSWTELEQVSTTEEIPQPVFRVQEDPSIRPNAFRQYSVPVDLIDIASGSDPRKMMDFVQAIDVCKQYIKAQGCLRTFGVDDTRLADERKKAFSCSTLPSVNLRSNHLGPIRRIHALSPPHNDEGMKRW
ncbi:LOW QUALITY PROTEIN: hypothetical protein T265_15587 [Opisthorchis viverrini]|uniref:Uncharacterized protein n=1 Tax=Opisthorchis viverrini TaxID=6198 RepID=A0A074Z7U1_OPIVI|nr:LOW QUALITY PROTEIN: hypothetical protein T265_15587 [Opisthorchis viverrini]KER19305.1 LOW QUALITY PROTEIN: hypothetical protein T265_15587 [Opisthorchis viverrini]